VLLARVVPARLVCLVCVWWWVVGVNWLTITPSLTYDFPRTISTTTTHLHAHTHTHIHTRTHFLLALLVAFLFLGV
jgi:hypothetical protein